MKESISKNIESYLKKNNMSIIDLEKAAGLKRSAISNIIHGRSKNPSLDSLLAISKILGFPIESIATDHPMDENQSDNQNTTDYSLGINAAFRLAECLHEKNISLSIDDFFNCCKDIYKYAIESNEGRIDERFVRWIAKKHG